LTSGQFDLLEEEYSAFSLVRRILLLLEVAVHIILAIAVQHWIQDSGHSNPLELFVSHCELVEFEVQADLDLEDT
jgi:hypothetical protein